MSSSIRCLVKKNFRKFQTNIVLQIERSWNKLSSIDCINHNDLKWVSCRAIEASSKHSLDVNVHKLSQGKSSSTSSSPVKYRSTIDKDLTALISSPKLIMSNFVFNIQESKIIEEEFSDCDPIYSPIPRLEESKFNQDYHENNKVIFDVSVSDESTAGTPRFENDSPIIITVIELEQENEEELNHKHTISPITDLKDPDNYIKYIKADLDFMAETWEEYEIAKPLWADILKLQKRLKQSSLKLNSAKRPSTNDHTFTDESEKFVKTIVMEVDDLIFSIRDEAVPSLSPTLVFEQKDEDGKMKMHYLYLNQYAKSFLLYIWEKFEVIVYSKLKMNLLTQLLDQIESCCPSTKFSAVFGANSCLSTMLIKDGSDDGTPRNDEHVPSHKAWIKNVARILKKRNKDNVVFLDNSLYSYINCLENYVPVPKFTGQSNLTLFYLKFFLEDFIKGRESVCNELFDGLDCCE